MICPRGTRAAEFAHGNWAPLQQTFNDVATYRYGLSLLIAALFALFGVSVYSAAVFPLLCSLATVALAWDISRRLGGSILTAHATGLLAALSGLDIAYATVPLPDTAMVAFGFLAVWLAIVALRIRLPELDEYVAIVAWLQQNRAEAERVGFYADHRTIRIVAALMGYPKQADWLETYPVYWRPTADGYEKPNPPIYGRNSSYVTSPELAGLVRTNPPRPDKGFWSVNPRYVRWVNRISRGQWLAAYATELPVTIIPSNNHDDDGKTHRIEGSR